MACTMRVHCPYFLAKKSRALGLCPYEYGSPAGFGYLFLIAATKHVGSTIRLCNPTAPKTLVANHQYTTFRCSLGGMVV